MLYIECVVLDVLVLFLYCVYFRESVWWLIFFFFSSRRRHTRYWRDWSSDVCSSDLYCRMPAVRAAETAAVGLTATASRTAARLAAWALPTWALIAAACAPHPAVEPAKVGPAPAEPLPAVSRSEERRVGKEGSVSGWP